MNKLLDFISGARRSDEVEPIPAWLMPFDCNDLNDIAARKVSTQRHHLAIDPGPDTHVADVGVHAVGEV